MTLQKKKMPERCSGIWTRKGRDMKSRKVLVLMLALCLATLSVAGCGKKAEKTEPEEVEITEEAVEEIPEPEPEPIEAAEPVEPAEQEEPTWFDEQKLSITPQGKITYVTGAGDEGEPAEEIHPSCNVSITETTEDCPEGYKKVVASFESDFSECSNKHFWLWVSAFDRYTGTSFEFDNTHMSLEAGESASIEGAVLIRYGDDSYDVKMEFSGGNDFPIWTDHLTVTCPVEYDGTVFQIGYWDAELSDQNDKMDYATQLYTIDQTPAYDNNGHDYYYFSNTND